ncbi:hypothetical protein DFP73DRAFT_617433 [Morchella snyderi]|nr:hypothetical protein DFP73DRAFT_617433 [Morchella snyderi]
MQESLSRIFLIFDALDECHEEDQRRGLIPLFERLGMESGMSLFSLVGHTLKIFRIVSSTRRKFTSMHKKERSENILKKGSTKIEENGVLLRSANARKELQNCPDVQKEWADVNTPSWRDRTALHRAIRCNSKRAFKILIDNGADINAPDPFSGDMSEANNADFWPWERIDSTVQWSFS